MSTGSSSRRWIGLATVAVLAISGAVALLFLPRPPASALVGRSAVAATTSPAEAQPSSTPLVPSTPPSTPAPAPSPATATAVTSSPAPASTPTRATKQPDVLHVTGLTYYIVGCANGTSCLGSAKGVIAPPTTRRSPYLSPAGNAGCTNDPAVEITEHFSFDQRPAGAAPIAAYIYWSYDGTPFSSKNVWETWAMAGAGVNASSGYDTFYDQQIHTSTNSATNPVSLDYAVTWTDAHGAHRLVAPTLFFFWRC